MVDEKSNGEVAAREFVIRQGDQRLALVEVDRGLWLRGSGEGPGVFAMRFSPAAVRVLIAALSDLSG